MDLVIKLSLMKILFVLLILSSYTLGQYSGIRCEDVEALTIEEDWGVLDNYTGRAIRCVEGWIETDGNYLNGKPDGDHMVWHRNGQLKKQVNWKDGKPDGVEYSWFSNGEIMSEFNWKEGHLDGVQRVWHGNGQLLCENNRKDDKIIDDKVVFYNPDGAIYKTVYFENGKDVRCEGYCP